MYDKQTAERIGGGIFLIGLGALFITGLWWPGILLVIGISAGVGHVLRGQYFQALVTALIFFSIPVLVTVHIAWNIWLPVLLIGLGVGALARSLYGNRA